MRTLQLWTRGLGLNRGKDCLSLTFNDISRQELETHVTALVEHGADMVALAGLIPNKRVERFDRYIDERLLDKANSEYRLDLEGAQAAARRALIGAVVPASG